MTKKRTKASDTPRFWQAPGHTFQVSDDHGNPWPPGFVARLTTPTPTEASRVAISHKASANRRARMADGAADPLTPPLVSRSAA